MLTCFFWRKNIAVKMNFYFRNQAKDVPKQINKQAKTKTKI